ncbi:MAG: metallophosphoesterase family protein [Desulfosarcinaceae bacterium]|jgi:predicted phosphodiesterase
MKLALFSDVHGNYEALKQVLADIDNAGVDRVICLGDCIGYGPEPEEVLAEIIERKIDAILGNHELAVCDPRHMTWFNPLARASLKITIEKLSQASIAYIKTLPSSLVIEGFRCVHGFPPDSSRTYLFQKSPNQLKEAMAALQEPVCFIGHTHELEAVNYNGNTVERRPLKQGRFALSREHRYLINIGSVGQPRDGNNQAKYVILDLDAYCLETRFISYDIAVTVAKIKAAGMPEQHANRLW